MGQFSIYNLVFLLAAILPFIMLKYKPAKTGLILHFIGWYIFGYIGFVACVALGSSIEEKFNLEKEMAPISHQIEHIEKGVTLI